MTTYTPSLRLWQGTPLDPAIKDQWAPPLNTNDTLIEQAILGTALVSINGLATYTLTTANGAVDQARPAAQRYTGALAGTCTVTLPNVPKLGWGQNNTTGGQSVVLTSGAGTTATLPPHSGTMWYYAADGATNVVLPTVGFGGLEIPGTSSFGTVSSLLGANAFTLFESNSTTACAYFLNQHSVPGATAIIVRADRTDGVALQFNFGPSTVVGGIVIGSGGTQYLVTSDYRKKTVHGPANAMAIIAGVPVHDAEYTGDPATRRPMFLAHELQALAPWAVRGVKDAERDIGDLVGPAGALRKGVPEPTEFSHEQSWTKTGTEMVTQQVDLPGLVPALWATVQQLIGEVQDLKAQVTALKAK